MIVIEFIIKRKKINIQYITKVYIYIMLRLNINYKYIYIIKISFFFSFKKKNNIFNITNIHF